MQPWCYGAFKYTNSSLFPLLFKNNNKYIKKITYSTTPVARSVSSSVSPRHRATCWRILLETSNQASSFGNYILAWVCIDFRSPPV